MADAKAEDTIVATNPFVNETNRRIACFQKLKIALMAVFVIPRLLIILLALVLIWMICMLATVGFKPTTAAGLPRAMGACRMTMLAPARWLVRLVLLMFGVFWISETYPKGTGCCFSPTAPIVVANHCSFLDALYFSSRFLPAAVAKSDVANYPIVGSILKAMQPILVYRGKKDKKRKGALQQIIERVQAKKENTSFPPILIFPEGTTHNTKALTMFKRGAFVPASPVQPVIIKYPFCAHDVSWTPDVSLAKVAMVTLCQVFQRIEVEYLPVYHPKGEELTNPALYARNVRALMAQALHVPVTNHAYEDVKLLSAVSAKYGLQHITPKVDVANVRNMMQLDFNSVKDLLSRFRAADADGNGTLAFPEFCQAMQLDPSSEYSRRVFDCVDADGDGSIDFREVTLGLSFAGEHRKQEKLQLAFTVYDQNGDGVISKDELRRVLTTVQELDDSVASTEIERVIHSASCTDSGQVTFEEFCRLAQDDESILSMAVDMARKRAGLPTVTPKRVPVSQDEETKQSN